MQMADDLISTKKLMMTWKATLFASSTALELQVNNCRQVLDSDVID
jgi:hypothetical protein